MENDVRFLSLLGMKNRYPDCPFQWYGEKGLSFEFNGKSEGRQGYLFSVAQSDFLSLLYDANKDIHFCIRRLYSDRVLLWLQGDLLHQIFFFSSYLSSLSPLCVYILCMRR